MKRNNSEGRLQFQIIKYLKILGAAVGKTKTMGVKRGRAYCYDPYCFRGFPDLTCFHNNNLYFIEVKSPTGKMSPEQESFRLLCSGANIHYLVAKSFDDVVSVIY